MRYLKFFRNRLTTSTHVVQRYGMYSRLESVLLICICLWVSLSVLECSHNTLSVNRKRDLRSDDTNQVVLNRNEVDAVAFLEQFNILATEIYYKESLAEWTFYINITEHNKELLVSIRVKSSLSNIFIFIKSLY